MIKLCCYFFALCVVLLWGGRPQAGEGRWSLDSQNGEAILWLQIPWETKVLLQVSDLPQGSPAHEGVVFGRQKFAHLAPSPDGAQLAFSVDGSQHDWLGVLDLKTHRVSEAAVSFEGEVGAPFWSADSRFLAAVEAISQGRKIIDVIDLKSGERCRLEGKKILNKYWNVKQPWWNASNDRIFFQVHYNNTYRNSLGLKSKEMAPRIGESDPQCQEVKLYSVSEFMEKYPQEASWVNVSSLQEKP